MKSDVVIQSRIAPTAIGAGMATIVTATFFYWPLAIWSSSESTSRLGYCVAVVFLLAITFTLALVTWSKWKNRSLVILRPNSITFFHNSWKGRSVTLNREEIAAIRVDQSYSDGEGADVVVRLKEPPQSNVAESKVWRATRPENTLIYEYGDATMSSDELDLMLQLWTNDSIRVAE